MLDGPCVIRETKDDSNRHSEVEHGIGDGPVECQHGACSDNLGSVGHCHT